MTHACLFEDVSKQIMNKSFTFSIFLIGNQFLDLALDYDSQSSYISSFSFFSTFKFAVCVSECDCMICCWLPLIEVTLLIISHFLVAITLLRL